ncbi:MAG TPA: tRNA lysidine(34) synthetase TilS [Eudoraea sp.]|nr:tRNA lysidine(34) synthetase TilS [Eudoraea sp.]
MLIEFEKHIKNAHPELQDYSFLLACSGGVDSVVLAHLCNRLDLDFIIAHCNFNLRGTESDADESLVKALGDKLKKKVFVSHFDTIGYINKNKVSVQMAARELRYAWFAEIMEEHHVKTLVTAHHADDNLETFLINLSRGTGIEGLRGIPEKTDSIARPLLAFTREQIEAYAREEQISWREDPSNTDPKYLRSRIRMELVPHLKGLHPMFMENFAKTLGYVSGSASIVINYITTLKKGLFKKEDSRLKIDISSLLELEPVRAHLYELFKEYGFTEWDDVHGLLTAMSGKEVRSGTHRLLKDRDHLFLQAVPSVTSDTYGFSITDLPGKLPVPMDVEPVERITETSKKILYVDKETLNHRLQVRKWRKGDYFYPMGMKGKKKVSKFFKDEKMDIISKEEQWLLCSRDAIVWVIGRRGDERFKVTENTSNILKFTINE